MKIHHGHPVKRNSKRADKLLALLSESKWIELRLQVAEHPNCPEYILARLSKDPSTDVRMNVASNPNVSHEILQALADDQSVDVRFYLAEDHSLPRNLLLKLGEDENPYVARRAQRTFQRVLQENMVNDTNLKLAPGPSSFNTASTQQILRLIRSFCSCVKPNAIAGTYK